MKLDLKKIIWYIFVAVLVITAIYGDINMVNSSNKNIDEVQLYK